jgi:hypothetical protein
MSDEPQEDVSVGEDTIYNIFEEALLRARAMAETAGLDPIEHHAAILAVLNYLIAWEAALFISFEKRRSTGIPLAEGEINDLFDQVTPKLLGAIAKALGSECRRLGIRNIFPDPFALGEFGRRQPGRA